MGFSTRHVNVFETSGKLIWDAGTRRSLRGFLSNPSIDYSGFHCFHLIMPHSSSKEAEGTGDVCSEPIGALIDLNLATWPCKCPSGSIETDFVWASTVTSGWRGVVTPLSLFGSSLPDHTDSLLSSSGPEATGTVREGSTHWGLGDEDSFFVSYLHNGFKI